LFGQRVCNGEDGHLLKRWGRSGRWGRCRARRGAAAGSSLIEVVHGSAVRLVGIIVDIIIIVIIDVD